MGLGKYPGPSGATLIERQLIKEGEKVITVGGKQYRVVPGKDYYRVVVEGTEVLVKGSEVRAERFALEMLEKNAQAAAEKAELELAEKAQKEGWLGKAMWNYVKKEYGESFVVHLLQRANKLVMGHMQRGSREWREAFAHIGLHFKPILEKPAHTLFEPAYRSQAAVEELVGKAVAHPSRAPVISRLKIGNDPRGPIAAILEHEFPQVIGNTVAGDKPAKILRVVVDITGRPVTVYPVKDFFRFGDLVEFL